MTYRVGGDIEATDYNQFIFQVRRILGDLNPGSISEDNGISVGYGRPVSLTEVSAEDIIGDEEWGNLIDSIKLIGIHQGTATTPPMPENNPVEFDIVEAYNSPISFQVLLDTLYSNRLSVAEAETVVVQGTSSQYTDAWTDIVEYSVDVDFGSWDSLRYFFNTGGTISIVGSYSPSGSPSTIETQLQSVLSDMSPLVISAYSTQQSAGVNQSPNGPDFGIYNLTSNYPNLSIFYLQSLDGSAYTDRGVRVEGVLKDQPGTSGVITFKVIIQDPDGDSKNGNLAFQVDYKKSVGSVPYTGSVSISTPRWFGINIPVPVVTEIIPSSGPSTGDTMVLVNGVNFLNVTGVTIGSVPVLGFSVISPTQIQVLTPPGTSGSSVPVVVTAVNGESNDNVLYTYTQPLSVDSPIIATGGTIEDRLVGWRCYRYHHFTTGGAFVVTNASSNYRTIDYIIVSGGGGGGNNYGGDGAGGGGGGGGFYRGSALVFPQSYDVIVGNGGAALQSGGASVFMNMIIPGGGHGGQFSAVASSTGSSGGGAGQGPSQFNSPASRTDNGSLGTETYGNAGGASIMYAGVSAAGGGGGGGAAGPGGNAGIVTVNTGYSSPRNKWYAYTNGGAGGAAISSSFLGTATSFCGGGGGAGSARTTYSEVYGWPSTNWNFTIPKGTAGAAGGVNIGGTFRRSGGRGAVHNGDAPQAGVPNRGGGGGGGNTPNAGAPGGSGLVSIRYPKCGLPEYDFDNEFVARRSLGYGLDSSSSTTLKDDRILVIGGSAGTSEASSLVFAYTPSTNTWQRRQDLPIARYDNGAATLGNGRVLVWGGSLSYAVEPITDARIYNPTNNTWSGTAGYPIACHEMAHCTLSNGDVFSVGGRTSRYDITNRAYIYRVSTSSWTRVADCPIPFTEGAASLMKDGRVIVCFGIYTYFYNVTSNTWTRGPNFPVSNAQFGMVTTPDGNVGAYGGIGAGNSIYVYNPCCNAWGISSRKMPLSLFEHLVNISTDGSKVYIISGVTSTGNIGNVYRQDLRVVETWTPMTAAGGTVSNYNDGTNEWKIHTFNESGNFSISNIGTSGGTVEYVLVGGGGGGGWQDVTASAGGGGGGGGVVSGKFNLSTGTYSVVVGQGGLPESPGENTTWLGITARGGGQGLTEVGTHTAGTGGSGGGGGQAGEGNYGYGGQGTANQGYKGGDTYYTGSLFNAAAGGGGAGGPGVDAVNTKNGGAGGPGVETTIRGIVEYFGGGGGGAGTDSAPSMPGAGGIGGGGQGSDHASVGSQRSTAGLPNTGGGGGGGNGNIDNRVASPGGSGVVIIRYKITNN